jgi:hypothetical protein
VIKPSSASNLRALVDALLSGDEVMRESAIARLAILGSRAMDRLLPAYAAARDADGKTALLRAMESIADRRSAPVAVSALKDGGDVAVAATGVLRSLLTSSHTPTATAALDALLSIALDRRVEPRVRLAASESLQDVPGKVRERVEAALRAEGEPAGDAVWANALAARLPDDPAALEEALKTRATSAPLTTLQKLVDAVSAIEPGVGSAAKRTEWRALRGALHQALARRGSRIALYDLRETIGEADEPLPISYLAALHVLGDVSCLEPIAKAYSRAQTRDAWWQRQLGAAFQAIVKRERLTKRHAILRRLQTRYSDAVVAMTAQ